MRQRRIPSVLMFFDEARKKIAQTSENLENQLPGVFSEIEHSTASRDGDLSPRNESKEPMSRLDSDGKFDVGRHDSGISPTVDNMS